VTIDENVRAERNKLLIGFGRAFGSALLFALPMLMTMEMWWLGFYMDRWRLALLLLINIPLLALLSHQIGFERTTSWQEDLRDAAIAYGIGIVASAAILSLLAILHPEMPLNEIVGKIALQSVPASIGAILGRSQLGGEGSDEPRADHDTSYAAEIFLMGVGALFLGLNVAPTEEMILISYLMTPWHALALVGASLLLMHGFVFAVGFQGQHSLADEPSRSHGFFRFTVVGYALVLLISLYVLWTFGRTDETAVTQLLMTTTVLGFPSAIGAAAARLIL
jgi:putative integral membrane protein (TIGR02587 family)